LRGDLAADLLEWIDALPRGAAGRVPVCTPLFNVPAKLIKILDRDLKAAGIEKKDDRGRTVDVHALRHSHASHLSARGVHPRVAQESMRHSDIKLMMGVYTDERMLDVRAALDQLPALPLGGQLAPQLALTGCKPWQPSSLPDKNQGEDTDRVQVSPSDVSGSADKRREPLTTPVNGSGGRVDEGIRTPDTQIHSPQTPRHNPKTDKASCSGAQPGCSAGCSDDPQLARVVGAWPSLPEPIRRAVLAMIDAAAGAI
jgi:hypothetical protein